MMKKILIVFLLTSVSSLFNLLAKPNILWISAEDIGRHFGCYGDPNAITPNIDELASEGTRFTIKKTDPFLRRINKKDGLKK